MAMKLRSLIARPEAGVFYPAQARHGLVLYRVLITVSKIRASVLDDLYIGMKREHVTLP